MQQKNDQKEQETITEAIEIAYKLGYTVEFEANKRAWYANGDPHTRFCGRRPCVDSEGQAHVVLLISTKNCSGYAVLPKYE